MKTFVVPLTRTTVETSNVTVQAPDKRTAGFMAAQAPTVEWSPKSQVTKVGTVELEE